MEKIRKNNQHLKCVVLNHCFYYVKLPLSIFYLKQQFMDKYEKEIKKLGMLHEYHDSKEYLLQNLNLVCEDTANYLTLWCVNLEVEEVYT